MIEAIDAVAKVRKALEKVSVEYERHSSLNTAGFGAATGQVTFPFPTLPPLKAFPSLFPDLFGAAGTGVEGGSVEEGGAAVAAVAAGPGSSSCSSSCSNGQCVQICKVCDSEGVCTLKRYRARR